MRVVLFAFTIGLLPPGIASAADAVCGLSAGRWNVPSGSMVRLGRPAGIVKAVVSNVGESGTHVMLSHGADTGYITHAHMQQPPTQSDCQRPFDATLPAAWPGTSQVDLGAAYQFIYGPQYDGISFVYYQNGNQSGANVGEGIAEYAWWSAPYRSVASTGPGGSASFYQLQAQSGVWAYYGMGNFVDGDDMIRAAEDYPICSGALAELEYRTFPYEGQIVDFKTYTHSQTVNAAWGVYNEVQNECNNQQSFINQVKTTICSAVSTDVCVRGANQILNTMFINHIPPDRGGWRDNTSSWSQYALANSATVAKTISPDVVGGWVAGMPLSGQGASPWAYDTNHTVSWNQAGGNMYGCWY